MGYHLSVGLDNYDNYGIHTKDDAYTVFTVLFS